MSIPPLQEDFQRYLLILEFPVELALNSPLNQSPVV